MANKFQKFVAKVLDLSTKEELNSVKFEMYSYKDRAEALETEMNGVRKDFRQLREDMRLLYNECRSDINRVDKKIAQVKPVLKVEDEAAVKFIKGILSKHDTAMQTNQSALHSNIAAFQRSQSAVENATRNANEAANRLNNILNGLGFEKEHNEEVILTIQRLVRELIKERATS